MNFKEQSYAWWINITNPYRLLFGNRKGGFVWIKRKGKFWLVSHDGITLYSPSAHFLGASVSVFEARFEPVLKVNPGDTVMDVGASVGDTSILFAMKCAPGKIIAVEPELRNMECLKLNLAKFNHRIIGKAAWNRKEKLKFNINPSVAGHSIAGREDDIRTEEVEADTIDNMVQGERIDFLKIDVQGAELQVLEGAVDVLARVKKVVVEAHNTDYGNTSAEVIQFLKDRSFTVKTTPQVGPPSYAPIVHAWKEAV
jgi:FkbM family methyltransferase